jgi:hypothetical protein
MSTRFISSPVVGYSFETRSINVAVENLRLWAARNLVYEEALDELSITRRLHTIHVAVKPLREARGEAGLLSAGDYPTSGP